MNRLALLGLDLLPWGLAVGLAAALDRLRAYEPRPAALSDNLQWQAVAAPGVVESRDGAFSRTWRYQGVDPRVVSPEELNALSEAFNRALVRLGPGVMLHADAVRKPALPSPPGKDFPHALAYLFDLERYELYRDRPHFETEFFLTLTWGQPSRTQKRLERLFVTAADEAAQEAEVSLGRFEDLSALLENHLGTQLHLERLSTPEQLAFLHHALTGLSHSVAEPASSVPLASVLSDQELVGGWKPRIGEQHLRVVRVNAYPTEATVPAILDPLTDLPCAYRWSTRVLTVPPEEADRRVKNLQWIWYTRRQDTRARLRKALLQQPNAAPDPDEREIFEDRSARAMATDSAELLARLHSGHELLCAYTTKVVVLDEDAARAEATARQCIKALARRGFGAALETVNTLDAWLGSLPGHGTADLRRDALPSGNVADLLPVTGRWPGLSTIPSRYFPPGSPPLLWTSAEGATPFRFNLHHQDVMHAFLLGPTGAGKSYLTAHIALQFLRYPGAQVFVFDKGYSHFLPCLAAGGVHYDIASREGASQPFQPLRYVEEEGERAWAAQWLDTLLRLQGLSTTAEQRSAMARGLVLLAHEPPGERTLDLLILQVPDPAIQAALKPYASGGALAGLVNGSSDPLADSYYLCFELGHILEADPRALVPVQLYLAHALAKRRSASRPTLLVWDEAWRALEDPLCRAWIKNDLATARKQNCGVLLITQSLAQVAEPDLRTLIDEAAQTKVFLPNPAAGKPQTRKLYEALGLSERLCDLVAGLTPKRDYLYVSRYAARVFELGETSLARALLSPPAHTTEEALVGEIRALVAAHPEDWLAMYLRQRGCGRWADRLAELPQRAAIFQPAPSTEEAL